MVALTEQELAKSDSLDWHEIETQLAEIGVKFLPLSWEDEFLMAENLQNYFAEVIAGYSLLELREEENEKVDEAKLIAWENASIELIRERSKYFKYSLSERQTLLIRLMKEAKKIEKLRA
jgi:hypothetical protein